MTSTKGILSSILWIMAFSIMGIDMYIGSKNTGAVATIPREEFNEDEFYANLVRVGMEARIIVDDTGKIIFASKSASDIVGYLPRELVNKPSDLIIPDRYKENHYIGFKKALERIDDRIVSTVCNIKRKDETERSVEIRTRVVDTQSGKVVVATLTPADQIEEVKMKE